MADKMTKPQAKKVLPKKVDELDNKISVSINGMENTLDKENDSIENIVKQTTRGIISKYGSRTDSSIINYYTDINLSNVYTKLAKDNKDNPHMSEETFKEYMNNNGIDFVDAISNEDRSRIVNYDNYRAIYNHIPECAQALDTYKDNIMSPDDFTKTIFNIDYENTDDKIRRIVEEQAKDLVEKYKLDELADEVISNSLRDGDAYVACISIDDDMSMMLSDKDVFNNLNESYMEAIDNNCINHNITKESLKDIDLSPLNECYKLKDDKKSNLTEDFIELFNERVKIGSSKELLLEKLELERDLGKGVGSLFSDIKAFDSKDLQQHKRGRKSKKDSKPLYLNGSSIKLINPENIIELSIDNVCYGYYYVEKIPSIDDADVNSTSDEKKTLEVRGNIISNNSTFSPKTSKFVGSDLTDQKINLLSQLFIDVLAKKIDKNFIRNNKEFKDLFYNLVKEKYILEKDIKVTYFAPEEIVSFKVPAIYRKIVFFAKLYLSTLVNMILIKLGRGHDKRLYYIETGLDADYEQAVSSSIKDIKTKEFTMESFNDTNTILRLNPGQFDDIFIPTVNGERPLEIDTLTGMDTDINNDFIDFLKSSMLSGIGVPRDLIDSLASVDFARTLSAQNGNFLRAVIRYQKKFGAGFTVLLRRIYLNEYRYINNTESKIADNININDLKVTLPSPATLNMENLSNQIQAADGNAGYFSEVLVTNGDEQLKAKVKAKIFEDSVPSADWEKYKKFLDDAKKEINEESLEPKSTSTDDMGMGGGGYGGY